METALNTIRHQSEKRIPTFSVEKEQTEQLPDWDTLTFFFTELCQPWTMI